MKETLQLTPEEHKLLGEFMERESLPDQSFRVIPTEIVDYDEKELVSSGELVERYFPKDKPIPKDEWLKIRQTAYQLYKERIGRRGFGDARGDWNLAIKICAIRKYINERKKSF